jgi:hypothetical protein
MAQCGKCGRDLPVLNGRAIPFWHECYKLLKGGRQITIDITPEGYTVTEENRFADRLGFDEMIGQIISLTHPSIPKGHGYQMLTLEQWRKAYPYMYPQSPEAKAHTEEMTNPAVVDGQWPEVAPPVEPPAPVPDPNILRDEDIPF